MIVWITCDLSLCLLSQNMFLLRLSSALLLLKCTTNLPHCVCILMLIHGTENIVTEKLLSSKWVERSSLEGIISTEVSGLFQKWKKKGVYCGTVGYVITWDVYIIYADSSPDRSTSHPANGVPGRKQMAALGFGYLLPTWSSRWSNILLASASCN